MRKATILQLLAQRKRLLGIGLAIAISAGFLGMTLLFGEVIREGFRNAAASEYRNVDFVIDTTGTDLGTSTTARIADTDGVASVEPAATAWIDASANGRTMSFGGIALPESTTLADAFVLDSGHLPANTGEIVLSRAVARNLRVEPGDTVSLILPEATTGRQANREFTVSGIWSGQGQFGSDEFDALLPPDDFMTWSDGLWVSRLYVLAAPGTDMTVLEQQLATAGGNGLVIRPVSQVIDEELEERAEEVAIQERGVQAFALLTLIVAGIVVSNTFAILVVQRTRDIALFRCAGATSAQVRTMVLTEAVVIGIVAAAIGTAAGVGLTALVLRIVDVAFDAPNIPSSVGLSPAIVLIPIVAGTILTILAAWGPARLAMHIDPLQALRMAHLPAGSGIRPGLVRAGTAVLCLAGGTMLLLGGAAISFGGARPTGLLIGMLGGCVSFLGVLLGAQVLVPGTVALAGRVLDRRGPTARIAVSNAVRNPRRTSSTAIALVIGVALVTMMSVGAASLKATLAGEIDAETPWDISVSIANPDQEGAGVADLLTDATQQDGVAAGVSLGRLPVEASPGDGAESLLVNAQVVNPEDLAATWRDAPSISGFAPGHALVPNWVADEAGVDDGDTVSLSVNGQPLTLEVIRTRSFDNILITEQDIDGFGVTPLHDQFWLRLDDGANTDSVIDAVYAQADELGLAISVTAVDGYRETITDALDALLLVVTGLLAVAMLVAVIGVGNTLTLSVIERTRESALLRALGFTRRQLRQSLAVEGALLAAIGTLLGIVLGAVYGWIGAVTVVGNAWPVSLAFPFARIGLVALIAIACGVLASVLPARRAATADPVAALADA